MTKLFIAGLLAFAPSLAFAQAQPAPAGHAGHVGAMTAPMPVMSGKSYKLGDLVIESPWTRATPKGAAVAGGFMKITNKGAAPDTLVGGSFPGAGKFQVHEMAVTDGVMKMRELAGGLVIKPGETVELKPGSFHVMMMDLAQPVEQGAPIKGKLRFEKAGEVEVEYDVAKIGGAAPEAHKH
jgi:hypothetical protein